MLGLDTHAGIRHGEVSAVLVHAPAHLDGAFDGGVFRRIVDQVEEG